MEKRLISFLKVLIFGTFFGMQSNSSFSSEFLSDIFNSNIQSINYQNTNNKTIYLSKTSIKNKSRNKSKITTNEKLKDNSKKDLNKFKSIEFDDLITLIEENNLELKAEKSKLEQSKNNSSILMSELKPSLQLSANGLPQYTFGEGDNPKKESKELKGSLSATISYKLYDPVRLHNFDLAKNQLSKAQITYDILKNKIVTKAEKFFIEFKLASKKVEIAENAFLLSESSLDDAKILNKALVVSDIEVLEAESQLARDKKFLNDKINDLELITISLSEILGINKEAIKKIKYANNILGFWEMDLKETINFASLKNKDLEKLKYDFNISQNKSNKELGKSKPSITLVNTLSSSINQGQSNVIPPVDFNKTGSEYQNTIGLTAKWDIFNGGKDKYIRQLKKNKSKEFKLRIKDKENKIKINVSESFKLLKTSLKNIFNTSAQVNNNKNILNISRLRFNAGVASQREIINNQRDLTQSKIVFANSIANYNKNLIELKNMTNLSYLKKCENSPKSFSKTNNSFNDIDLRLACDIQAIRGDEFSLNSKEYKIYKNKINKIIQEKNSNKKPDNFQKNINNKQNSQNNIKEKQINFDSEKSFNSYDDCDEIDNSQIQKKCFDTYL